MQNDFRQQDERCLHKKQYLKKTAQTVKNQRAKEGIILRIYPCPLCKAWHLTHKVKKPETFIREATPYKREKFIPNFEDDAE